MYFHASSGVSASERLLFVGLLLLASLFRGAIAGSSSRAKSGGSDGSSDDDGSDPPSVRLQESAIWRLQKELLTGYNPAVRPVGNPKEPVNVKIDLVLFNLIDLDEKKQTLSTNCEMVLLWYDYFLQWNSSDYDGVQQIRVDPSRIWKPDVILYNSASTDYNAAIVTTNMIVRSDGSVRYLMNGAFTSVCDTLNVAYFPFDQQTCSLKFAPWTMDITAVRLSPNSSEGNLDVYTPIGEFKMLSLVSANVTDEDPCCPNTTFDSVTYLVKIHRRPMFFIINYIFPAILINAIGVMVFYVPNASGEKVTLGISAMLAMVVFLMAVTNVMPPAVQTPLLSVYYCASIVLMTMEVLFSILVLNVYHRGQYGKQASDPTIAAAICMAKVTLTELKDPTGHFAVRKAAMAKAIKRYCCFSAGQEIGDDAKDEDGKLEDTTMRFLREQLSEQKFWRAGNRSAAAAAAAGGVRSSNDNILTAHGNDAVPGAIVRAGSETSVRHRAAAARPGTGGHIWSNDADFALRFGIKTVNELDLETRRTAENIRKAPETSEKMAAGLALLTKQMDRGLKLMAEFQENDVHSGLQDSLEMEFMELARVYDRFFLVTAFISTVVTSAGILLSSPFSMNPVGAE